MAILSSNDEKRSGIAGSRPRVNAARRTGVLHRIGEGAGVIVRFFSKPWPKALLRIAVTAAFVYLVNRSVSADDAFRLLGDVKAGPAVAAVVLGTLSFFLQTLRWRFILRENALPFTMGVSLKTMLRGSLLAFITPGRIGELFRALQLDKKRRVTTIVAVVEERSFAVAITVIAGIACMAIQAAVYHTPFFMPIAAASVLFGVAVGLIVAMVVLKVPVLPGRASGFFAPDGPAVTYFHHLHRLPFIPLSLLSVAAHLLLLVQTALLFSMFGGTGLIEGILVAGQAFSFMLLLPFFIANIGLREYAFALFIGRLPTTGFEVSMLQGVSLGVGTSILIINIILPAVIGLVWLLTDKKSVGDGTSASPSGNVPETPANPEFHDNAS